jgi:murein DD-endopeptidase MepM/ murein hydrolase activator NlpD
MRWGAVFCITLIALCACTTTRAPIIYGPPVRERLKAPLPQGPFQPNAYLRLCPGLSVSNAPEADASGWIVTYKPVVAVSGFPLATAPVNDACFSSGFGLRNGRPHQGIDLASYPASFVYSAAPALVLEVSTSPSYGNQVVLDHGDGLFTRYAHLEYHDPNLREDTLIGFGQPLGKMGRTGQASGVHLHFEILMGDYNTARGSKGLTPIDPFSLPAYQPPAS